MIYLCLYLISAKEEAIQLHSDARRFLIFSVFLFYVYLSSPLVALLNLKAINIIMPNICTLFCVVSSNIRSHFNLIVCFNLFS